MFLTTASPGRSVFPTLTKELAIENRGKVEDGLRCFPTARVSSLLAYFLIPSRPGASPVRTRSTLARVVSEISNIHAAAVPIASRIVVRYRGAHRQTKTSAPGYSSTSADRRTKIIDLCLIEGRGRQTHVSSWVVLHPCCKRPSNGWDKLRPARKFDKAPHTLLPSA